MLLPYSRLLFLSSALLYAAPADIPDVLTEESGKFQRLLASPVPELRIEGAQGASHLKLQSLEPNLIQLLKDKDPQVRREAAKALSRCGTWKAVPGLISLLGEDSSWPVREHSLLALRQISGQLTPGLAKPSWEKWWTSTSLKEKQKRLFAEMASPDPDKRLAAARSLRCMATPESEAQILELLEKSNLIGPEQRALLTEALGRIGTGRSMPYLLGRASAGDRAAAWAVGQRGGKEAEDALLKGFRRNRSMDFMLNLDRVKSGKCGPFVAVLCRELPSLINNSQRSEDVRFDPSPRQRVTANLIRRSGRGPALVDLVLKQLEGTVDVSSVPKDLRPMLNQMCTVVQPGFIREGFGSSACLLTALYHVADDRSIAPRLVAQLRNPSLIVRIYAALTLGKLKAPEGIAPVIAIIREGYPFSDSTALASGKHTSVFRDVNGKRKRQSQTIRWLGYFCMAMGRTGTVTARKALEEFAVNLKRPRDVRYGSVVGLGFIGSKESLPALQKAAAEDPIWMVGDTAKQTISRIQGSVLALSLEKD